MSATRSWPLRRLVLLVGVAVLIPVTFVAACTGLLVFVGRQNARDEARAKSESESDHRLKRPLVSTDGRILFNASMHGVANVYVVNVDGSGLAQLTHATDASLASRPPMVSPDGTRLAVSTRSGVDVVRLDRADDTTHLARPAGSLSWSPDGRSLASLWTDETHQVHLSVFDPDGTAAARDHVWPAATQRGRQTVEELAWAPDGGRFAFTVRIRSGYRGASFDDLYLVRSDGSGPTNLTRTPAGMSAYGGLAWSPDGQRLAFRSAHGIGTVDANLRWTSIVIPRHETGALQRPAWSPAGDRLAWAAYNSVVVGDPDGAHQDALTRGRCRGVQPTWSGDGLRIAFLCRDAQGSQNIVVMNADGSGLTAVTQFTVNAGSGGYQLEYPVWVPQPAATRKHPN